MQRLVDTLALSPPDASNVLEQRAVVTGLSSVIERLNAVRALWLAPIAADTSLKLEGHRNAGMWLSSETGLTPAEASRAVRLAETAAKMPEIHDAWAAGEINGSAVALLGTIADQPGFADAAPDLLEAARTAPASLGKVVADFEHEQRSRESLDERNRRQRERRSVTLTRTADGMTRLEGLLHPEAASSLRTSLETLMAPDPEGSGVIRTYAQRQADALVELCQRGAARPDVPVDARPRVVILTPHDAFHSHSTTAARTTWGDPISGEDLRRAGCDAIIDRVTIDDDGLPLSVGRSVYTPPAHIRRAVIARDQGCIWPGCTAPAENCEVHHAVHWADHGDTNLDNLALGCGRHHDVFHLPGYSVTFIDGRPRISTPGGKLLPTNHDRLVTRPHGRGRPPDVPDSNDPEPSPVTAHAAPHDAHAPLSLFSP